MTVFERFKEFLECRSEKGDNKSQSVTSFLTNDDFVKRFGITKRTAQKWRDQKWLPFIKIGSKIYYRVEDVEQFIHNHNSNNKSNDNY